MQLLCLKIAPASPLSASYCGHCRYPGEEPLSWLQTSVGHFRSKQAITEALPGRPHRRKLLAPTTHAQTHSHTYMHTPQAGAQPKHCSPSRVIVKDSGPRLTLLFAGLHSQPRSLRPRSLHLRPGPGLLGAPVRKPPYGGQRGTLKHFPTLTQHPVLFHSKPLPSPFP